MSDKENPSVGAGDEKKENADERFHTPDSSAIFYSVESLMTLRTSVGPVRGRSKNAGQSTATQTRRSTFRRKRRSRPTESAVVLSDSDNSEKFSKMIDLTDVVRKSVEQTEKELDTNLEKEEVPVQSELPPTKLEDSVKEEQDKETLQFLDETQIEKQEKQRLSRDSSTSVPSKKVL